MNEIKHSFVKEILISEKLCGKLISQVLLKYKLDLDAYLYLHTLTSTELLYKKCIDEDNCIKNEKILSNLGYINNKVITPLGSDTLSKILEELNILVETKLDERTKDNLFMAETALKRLNKNMLEKI